MSLEMSFQGFMPNYLCARKMSDELIRAQQFRSFSWSPLPRKVKELQLWKKKCHSSDVFNVFSPSCSYMSRSFQPQPKTFQSVSIKSKTISSSNRRDQSIQANILNPSDYKNISIQLRSPHSADQYTWYQHPCNPHQHHSAGS